MSRDRTTTLQLRFEIIGRNVICGLSSIRFAQYATRAKNLVPYWPSTNGPMFARSRTNEIESSFPTEKLGNRSLARKRRGKGGEETHVARPTILREGNLRNDWRVR